MKNISMKKNAVLNAIKQVCQVIFSLITIPYVTRVLGAERYGTVNFGSSIVSYFALLAALGISTYGIREGALVRNQKDKISILASELFTINLFSMVLSYFLILLLLFVPSFQNYRLLILIQCLTIFFTTIGMDWINSVYEEYLFITLRYIFCQFISIVCMLIFVKKPEDYLVYAFIVVMASAGANILNFFHIRKYVKVSFRISGLRKHIIPILILFGNTVAITIYVNSDITMLGIYKGDTSVGIYSLASRIYSVIKLILNGIVLVTIPRLSVYNGTNDKEAFNKLLSRILIFLTTLMLPISIGLITLSRHLMTIMGGEGYSGGTLTLSILGIAVFFSLIAFFFTNCVLIPSKNEKSVFLITLLSAVLNIILNLFFIPKYDYVGAAITTLIAEILVSVLSIVCSIAKKTCHIRISSCDIFSSIVGSVFVLIICVLCINSISNPVICLIITVTSSVVIYFISLILMKNTIITTELNKIKRK